MKETLKIINLDHYGRGIGKLYNKTVFVSNALIDEEVEVRIINNKKNYCEAVVENYIKKCKSRVNPECKYFGLCGGCNIMHMDYDNQLMFKKNKVAEIISKFANFNSDKIKTIIGTNQYNYRNKITLQVSECVGLYKSNSYEVINIDKCIISNENINKIINKLNTMNLRNINQVIIRSSFYTDDIMVVFCAYDRVDDNYLVAEIKDLVTSIIKKYKNDEKCLYGKSTIIEKINDLSFNISASSFFQVNTLGMEKLYKVVKDYVNPNKDMSVLDLYCGTGTIGIYLSNYVKEVFGVEINKYAVKDAINNANLNDISNIEFVCADAKDVISNYKNIDVAIIDPPRAGLSKEAIKDLIKLNSKKIVYVSCDPITLARDINILKEFYDLDEITLVDMFPNTYHVESVCVLNHK